MNSFREVFGVLELVFSLVNGLLWLIKFIFGWWADLWTRFYDKRFPLSPLWARLLGIICSLVTHPVIVISVAYYYLYPIPN